MTGEDWMYVVSGASLVVTVMLFAVVWWQDVRTQLAKRELMWTPKSRK